MDCVFDLVGTACCGTCCRSCGPAAGGARSAFPAVWRRSPVSTRSPACLPPPAQFLRQRVGARHTWLPAGPRPAAADDRQGQGRALSRRARPGVRLRWDRHGAPGDGRRP